MCEAIVEIFESAHENQPSLEIDHEALPDDDPLTYIFLARKAVGYLFYKPIFAAEIIISILKISANEDVMNNLEELILILLTSYPNLKQGFLEPYIFKKPEHVSKTVTSALDKLKTYSENIQNIDKILELLPTLRQHETYMRMLNQRVLKYYRKERQKLVFERGATKFVILYGRSSINYVKHSSSSSPCREKIAMQPQQITMTLPREYNFDPFGLGYRLWRFRNEKMEGR